MPGRARTRARWKITAFTVFDLQSTIEERIVVIDLCTPSRDELQERICLESGDARENSSFSQIQVRDLEDDRRRLTRPPMTSSDCGLVKMAPYDNLTICTLRVKTWTPRLTLVVDDDDFYIYIPQQANKGQDAVVLLPLPVQDAERLLP